MTTEAEHLSVLLAGAGRAPRPRAPSSRASPSDDSMADDRVVLRSRRDLVPPGRCFGGTRRRRRQRAGAARGADGAAGPDRRRREDPRGRHPPRADGRVRLRPRRDDGGQLQPRIARMFRRMRNQRARARERADHRARAPRRWRRRRRPTRSARCKGLAAALAGGQRTILEFAIAPGGERPSAAYYRAAARGCEDAKLLQLSATIMANEGQHLVASCARRWAKDPVPNAFETGEPTSGRTTVGSTCSVASDPWKSFSCWRSP